MIQEFKEFISKGNVLDMAVGVIIAGAFGAIVSSFTNEIMLPPLGQMLGGVDFSDLAIQLSPAVTDADGNIVTEAVKIGWGSFLQKIIDFLIIAMAVFLVVKAYNSTQTPAPEEPAGPTQEELLTQIRDALRNP